MPSSLKNTSKIAMNQTLDNQNSTSIAEIIWTLWGTPWQNRFKEKVGTQEQECPDRGMYLVPKSLGKESRSSINRNFPPTFR